MKKEFSTQDMEIICNLNRYHFKFSVMQVFKMIFSILFVFFITACQTSTGNPTAKKYNAAKIVLKEKIGEDGILEADQAIFQKHLQKLKQFATANHYSTQYVMLIDLAIHSGSKRFFMIRLSDEKIIHSGLVTHGSSPSTLQPGERQYSNVSGSLCSSLGRYKIGVAYQGAFGLAYKLHGLDTSNSNAFARAIVLHSHSCVPNEETDESICQSWGCPTVSPTFLQTIRTYIDRSTKPILMEIYDSTK